MHNKENPRDIYLMGIGGTGMGAFAGLLKSAGFNVRGSDLAVYSPMKEKLKDWQIEYKSPYHEDNLQPEPDLVIVGNVIKKSNCEAQAVLARDLKYNSFPAALKKLFLKNSQSIVASGTHGKTTCSSLLAHTLFQAKKDPGFLIGGIPKNFNESFRLSHSENAPFVVEGDEYDTAFFDKRAKFFHYDPKILLLNSIEFDHADIYRDLDHIIDTFAELLSSLGSDRLVIFNAQDQNIAEALKRAKVNAKLKSFGVNGDYVARNPKFSQEGIHFDISCKGKILGKVSAPLFGHHNLSNVLGCYGVLHSFGLIHEEITSGFQTFTGVKRRLEERAIKNNLVLLDDFAHHPSAVFETIRAVKQKYLGKKLVAIFEPRSATSCRKIFLNEYKRAFLQADQVFLAPVGRQMEVEEALNIKEIANALVLKKIPSLAANSTQEIFDELVKISEPAVFLFMSNGSFNGLIDLVEKKIFSH